MLAREDTLGIPARKLEDLAVDEPVVEVDIGPLQAFNGAQRLQVVRAQPGPDERDGAAVTPECRATIRDRHRDDGRSLASRAKHPLFLGLALECGLQSTPPAITLVVLPNLPRAALS
ncbi:MAG: hypothetical protein ACOCX4_08905, partial [Planctomycetota bacterium]